MDDALNPCTTAAVRRYNAALAADLLTINSDGDVQTCTVAEFVEANADDADLCDDVLALAPGTSTWSGGGAEPLVTITRGAQ